MADERLRDVIDEIDGLDSDRPSVEIILNQKSLRPKVPDTLFAKIIAVVVALGAIAEVVREIVK